MMLHNRKRLKVKTNFWMIPKKRNWRNKKRQETGGIRQNHLMVKTDHPYIFFVFYPSEDDRKIETAGQ